jgi:hypothetical protein
MKMPNSINGYPNNQAKEPTMRNLTPIRFTACFIVATLFAGSVVGQQKAIEWKSLNAEQQQVLQPVKEKWASMPPERQARLQRNAERWSQMSPEQRERIQKNRKRWQELSPDQRQMLRIRHRQFRQMPTAQRQAMRQAFAQFRTLPEAERKALREQFRTMSPEKRREWMQEQRKKKMAEKPTDQ